MVKHIGILTIRFDKYINKHGNTQPEKVISVNELKDIFFISNMNKSAGYDDTSFNVSQTALRCGSFSKKISKKALVPS